MVNGNEGEFDTSSQFSRLQRLYVTTTAGVLLASLAAFEPITGVDFGLSFSNRVFLLILGFVLFLGGLMSLTNLWWNWLCFERGNRVMAEGNLKEMKIAHQRETE